MRIFCLSLLLGLFFSFGHSQSVELDALTSIYPASFSAYDIEQGLLISCADEVFKDQQGRLWVNPCRNQAIYQGESFFQFDGEKSYPIAFSDSSAHLIQMQLRT